MLLFSFPKSLPAAGMALWERYKIGYERGLDPKGTP